MEIDKMLDILQLEDKRDAQSHTLSGLCRGGWRHAVRSVSGRMETHRLASGRVKTHC